MLATHVFGAPCSPKEIEDLARVAGIPLVFDAAHAFGALHAGVPVGGFGDAEVFSLTPTKPLVAGEGGLVATTRDDVAYKVRIGRDYANPGNYDTQFVGLNGRMSEMHAATALASLEGFDANQSRRFEIVERYRAGLARASPACACRRSRATIGRRGRTSRSRSTRRRSVSTATRCAACSTAEGVDTRTYFDPPVHRQTAYRDVGPDALPVTDAVSRRVVSLPVYPALEDRVVDGIVGLIARVHDNSGHLRGSSAG